MSDLSRLLDDVYEPGVKDDEKGWTSDEALDDAFSGWVPGPSEDASETEKALFTVPAAVTEAEPDAFTDTTSDPVAASAVARFATAVPSSIPSDPPSDRVESPAAAQIAATEIIATQVHDTVVDETFSASEWASAPAVETPAPAAPVAWSLEDDDILPKRSSANRFFAFRR